MKPLSFRMISAGFTLIEVLIALGITAIALMAGINAMSSLTRNADQQSLSMFGQICAENQLIAMRLLRQLPEVGNRQLECIQAGRIFQVEIAVRTTPNPNFRRVDTRIMNENLFVLQISTIMGRN